MVSGVSAVLNLFLWLSIFGRGGRSFQLWTGDSCTYGTKKQTEAAFTTTLGEVFCANG